MRFKVANYSRLEIRLDTLHIYRLPSHFTAKSSHKLKPKWPKCSGDEEPQKVNNLPALRSYILHIWGEETTAQIWPKFCTGRDFLEVITDANFGNDRLRDFGVARGQIVGFSIGFRRRPYNTLALPCVILRSVGLSLNCIDIVLTLSVKQCYCLCVGNLFTTRNLSFIICCSLRWYQILRRNRLCYSWGPVRKLRKDWCRAEWVMLHTLHYCLILLTFTTIYHKIHVCCSCCTQYFSHNYQLIWTQSQFILINVVTPVISITELR